jgi:hypothetical protein
MLLIAGLLFGCFSTGHSSAQESIRPSTTGVLASEARQNTTSTGNYFLKAGPVDFSASLSTDVEYNDNVGLAEVGRESDIIIRPTLAIDSEWRITQLNTLHFDISLGYQKYLDHGSLDTRTILLDPGSQLSFDVYVGGILKLNFHDRFSIMQNPVDEPLLSNVANFQRFENTAGVTALFDFNDLKIVVGYDHFNYRTFESDFDFLDRSEEQFYASAGLRLSDAITVGLDGSGGLINYRLNINNDGTTWTAGPFLEATLSSYTTLRITGGWQEMNFSQTGTTGDTNNYGGWFGNLTISQRLNQYWTHSVSAGHEARLGLEVNFSEYDYLRYLSQWQINPRLNAGFEAFLEQDNESGTIQAQDSELARRWGGGISLSYRLGPKLTAGLQYHYVKKDSDLVLRSYYQNSVSLDLKYEF